MSDSPRAGVQWFWAGGSSRVSSPAPTPRERNEDAATTAITLVAGGLRSSSCRRERSDAAELVLEQLDEQWFCDNVVRWPSSRPGSPPGVIGGVIDKEIISPFRRRELGVAGAGAPSATQSEVVVTKPRSWVGERATQHPARPRHHDMRRLSDGDHRLRRYLDRDPISRRRILDPEVRRVSSTILLDPAANSSSPQPPSLPETPTKPEITLDQTRFCSEANSMEDVFSPLALPPCGPLVGVTEDEELENDLFAKMLANRPAKLTTINPGRLSRGPLQENTNSGTEPQTGKRNPLVRQRRRLKGTKSLTDLEYEELRGLKELGFEVSKDDLTPHVVRMFPGLQRQGIPPYNSLQSQRDQNNSNNTTNSNNAQGSGVTGAQNVVNQQSRFPPVQQHSLWLRRPDSPLLNTPFLDPSIDMKGQLKSWASEMATIVSIEC